MDHNQSKVKVYQSSDYGRFQMIDGNRAVNKRKIEKIIKEIRSGNDVLDESPILVTEVKNKLHIKDGQHRYLVARELKRPVHYIIKKQEMTLYNVAKINSNTEKWSSENFINAYAKAGNENYKQLDKFHKTYKISVGVCLSLLANGYQKRDSGDIGNLTDDFQQGKFIVKKYKDAVAFAEICKAFSAFPQWNTRGFIVAMSRILEFGTVDMDVLLKKFSRDTSKLTAQPNWKGYCDNLQRIYNFDNSKQKVIY